MRHSAWVNSSAPTIDCPVLRSIADCYLSATTPFSAVSTGTSNRQTDAHKTEATLKEIGIFILSH